MSAPLEWGKSAEMVAVRTLPQAARAVRVVHSGARALQQRRKFGKRLWPSELLAVCRYAARKSAEPKLVALWPAVRCFWMAPILLQKMTMTGRQLLQPVGTDLPLWFT